MNRSWYGRDEYEQLQPIGRVLGEVCRLRLRFFPCPVKVS